MDIDLERVQCFQQRQRGAGTFDGTRIGYAVRTFTNGGASLVLRAEELGLVGNAISVAFVSTLPARAATEVRKITETKFVVVLGNNGVADTATAQEIVDAVNASREAPFYGAVVVDGVMAADAGGALSTGLDYALDRGTYKIDLNSNVNVGMFYFASTDTMRVFQIDGKFGGATTVEVTLCSVDKSLAPDAAEETTVYTGAADANHAFFYVPPQPLAVMAGQALRVKTSSSARNGVARVWGHRAERLS